MIKNDSPDDAERFVTTYGYIRNLARQGDLTREGYSISVQGAESETETWRDWALRLELLVLGNHPATGGKCPGCGKSCPCPARKSALRIRRESIREQELRDAEHIQRAAVYSANRLQSMSQVRLHKVPVR